MAYKIEKINNALVITDTVSNKEIVDTPSNLVYYDVDQLDAHDKIRLENLSDTDRVHCNYPTIPLAEAVTSGDVAFTKASFKTFARTNLG